MAISGFASIHLVTAEDRLYGPAPSSGCLGFLPVIDNILDMYIQCHMLEKWSGGQMELPGNNN